MAHQDPHSHSADAVNTHHAVEAQYVRQGRGGHRILVLLIVSAGAAAVLLLGWWALNNSRLQRALGLVVGEDGFGDVEHAHVLEGPGVGAVAQEAQPGLDVQAVAGQASVGADAGEAGDVAVEGAPVAADDRAGQAARGEQIGRASCRERV